MPTPASSAAFARLVAARTRFKDVTRELNEAREGLPEFKATIADLEADADEAFQAFELATEAFSVSVKHLHDEIESPRSKTAKPT